jgi:hypothetical protein
MNVRLLNEQFDAFGQYLQSQPELPHGFLYETQQQFQQHWDPEAEDFSDMFDRSLNNPTTRRLWKSPSFYPKEIILNFAAMQEDFVRQMFKDLFDNEKSIDGRVSRFVFHCDELLKEYKEANPLSVDNNHFHDDWRMISLYLSLRFPDQYTPYDMHAFPVFLKQVLAKPKSDLPLIERYFKVTQTVYKLISKREDLMEQHYRRLEPGRHFMGHSLLLVLEFCQVTTKMRFW